jgi:hypothetical protein
MIVAQQRFACFGDLRHLRYEVDLVAAFATEDGQLQAGRQGSDVVGTRDLRTSSKDGLKLGNSSVEVAGLARGGPSGVWC